MSQMSSHLTEKISSCISTIQKKKVQGKSAIPSIFLVKTRFVLSYPQKKKKDN